MASPFARPRRRRCATPWAAAIEGTDCSVPPGEAPAALAFVTESLGSKLLFDAVLEVWADAENGRDKALFDRVAKSLAGTRMIYMMANQLPLLDAAGPAIGLCERSARPRRRTSGSIARDVFDLLSRLRGWTPSGTGPMTVVAFSDPNDLLSYRVVPEPSRRELAASSASSM